MTKIEWTHIPGYRGETWNPVTGCTKCSPGCEHCYAEQMAKRLSRIPGSGYSPEDPFKVTVHEDRWDIPRRATKPRAYFVCSMGDLFHEDVPFSAPKRVWESASACPQHLFLILTKRPARMLGFTQMMAGSDHISTAEWPRNVWLGVTAENQEHADKRIPLLLQIPAAKRFVSCEPILGPVDIRHVHYDNIVEIDALTGDHGVLRPLAGRSDSRLDWVIVGGESGPGARPMHPDWAASVRDQCQAASVPFFFKQWGEWAPSGLKPQGARIGINDFGVLSIDGEWYPTATGWNGREIDPETREASMLRLGKGASGRLLDGKEWQQFPQVQCDKQEEIGDQ